jgi:hypothetical protein
MLIALYISPLPIVLSTINHLSSASHVTFVNLSQSKMKGPIFCHVDSHHIQSSLILNYVCVF